MPFEPEVSQISFDAIRLRLASPEHIRSWSYGEVLKPETINYRTLRPERDGLFSERIFGPVKDWECFCGKYKRIRYKGVICDKCGVEVTRAQVRRERFGHIELATPVTHIWFLRGVPSQIGLMLDLSVQELERVVYFADFIVTRVNEEVRKETFVQIQEELKTKKRAIEAEYKKGVPSSDKETVFSIRKEERLKELQEAYQIAKRELADLKVLQILSESEYQDLSLKYGHIFEASIGAEAVYQILSELNLEDLEKQLLAELEAASGARKKKAMKRLKLVRSFLKNALRPEWMIIKTLPVLPPDLRPMVQLDGGRFATSDLNDLYRRVINRNNRLKRLLELNAPEVICRNEKRMLQEAVDALIDNTARHGKTVTASTGQKRMLKSLADTLKGKQGRFRQNLLGKRVDYSGRSVIVVGPELKLHECGLPKRMALELFKPFVIAKLIERQLVHNVRSANRFIETGTAEVWDILEEVTVQTAVLLNRAPTLHRLGIQAFQPVLIEGKAIQIHPMVCPAFNADFDGDQMAVHVPLTEEARAEAVELMLSSKNILLPSQGTPVTMPSQEIILGIYYLTAENTTVRDMMFADDMDAMVAYKNRMIGLQDRITVRREGNRVLTTAGRLIFNRLLPAGVGFLNEPLTKKGIQKVVARVIKLFGIAEAAKLLDEIKEVSHEYVTQSGISMGLWDLPTLREKPALIREAEAQVDEIVSLYEQGLLTKGERKMKSVEVWQRMKDRIQVMTQRAVNPASSVGAMVTSGARGQWAQMTQMVGIKGPVVNPQNETIELPIKSSFKEGFKVIEYFIASHGTRKGMADTALRTANAGYLTRRLVDVAQDITVTESDCQDQEGYEITKHDLADIGISFAKQIEGRFLLAPLTLPGAREPIAISDEPVTEEQASAIEQAGLERVMIRSVFSCKTRRGVCQTCYGLDLGYGRLVDIGASVGIIAAQSIGEPGTQLTLRTFHSGGVAGAQDVTTGLPRVDELFEARPVKKPALLAPIAGEVNIGETQGLVGGRMSRQKVIQIRGVAVVRERMRLEEAALDQLLVKDGQEVSKGDRVLETRSETIVAPFSGTCTIEPGEGAYALVFTERTPALKEFVVPQGYALLVKDGQEVAVGDQLTEGPVNVSELFEMKGVRAAQRYMLKEILYVYTSQGHPLNTKHLEIILRQMFSRVTIEEPGDTDFTIGDVCELAEVLEENERVLSAKKQPATFSPRFMGITKASLSTSSFLSAASFQETSKVLIQAAVSGKVDYLRGLKENVIIGKLIPAGTGLKSREKGE